jgi:RimJ/RimL family protein N-acetyltransferase
MTIPDPPLADDAVALRPWEPRDAPDIVRCCNDPLVSHYIPSIPHPYTPADAELFIARTVTDSELNLAITERPAGAVLGAVGVGLTGWDDAVAEIGYWLAPEARGRGAATRGLVLLSRWVLRAWPVARLHLTADVANLASQAVADRAGFVREAVMRNGFGFPDDPRDSVVYSLIPGDT